MRVAALALVGLMVFTAAGCGKKKSSSSKKKPAAATTLVKDPLAAARGWVPQPRLGAKYALDGKPRLYDKETVFELLDGGADVLLERGLRTLLHVKVKDRAEKFADYEIQVWDVTSPAQAKAMLGKEKAPEAKRVKLGDAAWAENGAVLVVKGRYLVRVMALPAGERKQAPVAEVARLVLATRGATW